MHVEMRPTESIRPYANNPRLNDAAVADFPRRLVRVGAKDQDGYHEAGRHLGQRTQPRRIIPCSSPRPSSAPSTRSFPTCERLLSWWSKCSGRLFFIDSALPKSLPLARFTFEESPHLAHRIGCPY
jgi:hypothetical protein